MAVEVDGRRDVRQIVPLASQAHLGYSMERNFVVDCLCEDIDFSFQVAHSKTGGTCFTVRQLQQGRCALD